MLTCWCLCLEGGFEQDTLKIEVEKGSNKTSFRVYVCVYVVCVGVLFLLMCFFFFFFFFFFFSAVSVVGVFVRRLSAPRSAR